MGSAAVFEVVKKRSMMPRQLRGLFQVLTGFLLILLLNVAVLIVISFISQLYDSYTPALPFRLGRPTQTYPLIIQIFQSLALCIGLSQLLYAIPIISRLNRPSKRRLMTGVIIGVVLTFLVNIGIFLWALVLISTDV